MTSTKPGPASNAGPQINPHHSCENRCTCSKIRDAYQALGNLATLVIRNLERDTQYGPISLSGEPLVLSPREMEDARNSSIPEAAQKRAPGFPLYWGFIRIVQSIMSLLTIAVFSVSVRESPHEHKAMLAVWILFAILSMLLSAFLAYARLVRSDWSHWLTLNAPLILAADVVTFSIHISIFCIFPQFLAYFYWYRSGFDERGWIPITTINFILHIWTIAIALYITQLLLRQGGYLEAWAGALRERETRRARKKKIYELVTRILDGSIDVVPIPTNSRPETRATTNQTQASHSSSASIGAVALVDTRGSHNQVLPSGQSQSQGGPSTTTFQVNHTSSRPSKFVLTTEQFNPVEPQRYCRMCGDQETSPPSYLHDTVAALPQIPLQSSSTNQYNGEEDDESSESTGLLKRPDTFQ